MGCEEIRDLLALYAGGEAYENDRAAVEAHVAVCAACARELDQYREARANLALLREGDAPPGTFKNLWSGVRADLFPKKPEPRLAWFDEALRYAAVLMVGLAIGVLAHYSMRREAAPAATASAPASPAAAGVPLVQPVGLAPVHNAPRLYLRTLPRTPAPKVDADGEYYLPRVESIPAGQDKDF